MSKKENEKILFVQMMNLVIRGSLLVVAGVMLLLIYIPFSDSIDAMFEPGPELLTGSYENVSSGGQDQEKVIDGIHVQTGMVYDENFKIVRSACTSCHSSKLITQNRATRDGWKQMIRWMQATQGLPDLGKREVIILDYLAKNYAPKDEGRRMVLDQSEIEWYALQLN